MKLYTIINTQIEKIFDLILNNKIFRHLSNRTFFHFLSRVRKQRKQLGIFMNDKIKILSKTI